MKQVPQLIHADELRQWRVSVDTGNGIWVAARPMSMGAFGFAWSCACVAAPDPRIAVLEAELAKARRERDDADFKAANREQMVDQIRADLRGVHSELQVVSRERDEAQAEVERLRDENTTLNAEVDRLLKQRSETLDKLDRRAHD